MAGFASWLTIYVFALLAGHINWFATSLVIIIFYLASSWAVKFCFITFAFCCVKFIEGCAGKNSGD